MNKPDSKIWLLIAVCFAIVLTTLSLSSIVTSPWQVMPELGADGGKNIFTYLYHVLYDKGIWFSGMNYPYGEHIVYTDGQPILSVPLSYINGHISIGTALSIMWWLISTSYVLSIVFCFKILRKFKVTPIIALSFAGLITLLSPQVLRLSGHYALSFCAVLPMLFYYTLQYHTSRQWKYTVYILLMGCFTTFLHPYFAAVALVWAGCYSVAYLLSIKDGVSNKIKHIIPLLVSVLFVFLLFGTIMRLTDPLKDRPVTPFGILVNCTHIKDIFSSVYSPFWAIVKDHTHFSKISSGGEGYTYPGLAVLIAVFISLAIRIKQWATYQNTPSSTDKNSFQPIWIIMALMALLFGMGAPFIWHLEWLLNYASVLKQFRTLGRFSWIFYYIISMYGAVLIDKWHSRFKTKERPAMAYGLLVIALGIWATEAVGYVNKTYNAVSNGRANFKTFTSQNELNWNQFLAQHDHKKEKFQAILVLPLFATGTEKVWLCSDENISAWSVAMGIKAGVQLHLPLVDIMMSRSSWGQTFNQVKTAGGPYTEKLMLNDIKSDLPFLLLHTDNAPLSPDQEYLLQSSLLLGHYEHCTVYACYPQKIKDNDKKNVDTAIAIATNMQQADTCIHCCGAWFIDHFDNRNYNNTPFGTGAKAYAPNVGEVICNIPITPAYNNQQYEFSCWFQVTVTDYKSPDCILEMLDSNSSVIASAHAPTIESTDNIYNSTTPSLWLRCNAFVRLPAATRYIRCKMLNFAEQPYLAIDELMIRPSSTVIISKSTNGQIMANNHLIKQGTR